MALKVKGILFNVPIYCDFFAVYNNLFYYLLQKMPLVFFRGGRGFALPFFEKFY